MGRKNWEKELWEGRQLKRLMLSDNPLKEETTWEEENINQ
jgi:hypothetical protein